MYGVYGCRMSIVYVNRQRQVYRLYVLCRTTRGTYTRSAAAAMVPVGCYTYITVCTYGTRLNSHNVILTTISAPVCYNVPNKRRKSENCLDKSELRVPKLPIIS